MISQFVGLSPAWSATLTVQSLLEILTVLLFAQPPLKINKLKKKEVLSSYFITLNSVLSGYIPSLVWFWCALPSQILDKCFLTHQSAWNTSYHRNFELELKYSFLFFLIKRCPFILTCNRKKWNLRSTTMISELWNDIQLPLLLFNINITFIWLGKQKKSSGLLYCSICFIKVVWTWTHNIAEICLYLHLPLHLSGIFCHFPCRSAPCLFVKFLSNSFIISWLL